MDAYKKSLLVRNLPLNYAKRDSSLLKVETIHETRIIIKNEYLFHPFNSSNSYKYLFLFLFVL